jgi:hypothetical protein
MKATVTMLDGTTQRITLPKVAWTGRDEIGTGMFREAVYIGTKSKRVVVQTYSQWEDRHTHGCIGTEYHEADEDEKATLAGEYDEIAEILDKENATEL